MLIRSWGTLGTREPCGRGTPLQLQHGERAAAVPPAALQQSFQPKAEESRHVQKSTCFGVTHAGGMRL